jgi:nucleoside-diphosphate-sugar epimerase
MAVGSGGGPRNRGLNSEQHRLLYSQIYAALPELTELKRVVWIGSGAEYGSAIDPLTESSLPAPISKYGMSKLHETNVFLALQFLGVPVCVIRPSVVFGKMQSPGMLIPSMVASLSRGEPFFLTAPADVRDFLHVDDLADLTLRSATCANVPLGLINGASGQSSAVLEVAYQLCDQMKVPRSQIRFNSPLNNSGEPFQSFSIEKAFHVLGWKPELTLTEGIERLLHGK